MRNDRAAMIGGWSKLTSKGPIMRYVCAAIVLAAAIFCADDSDRPNPPPNVQAWLEQCKKSKDSKIADLTKQTKALPGGRRKQLDKDIKDAIAKDQVEFSETALKEKPAVGDIGTIYEFQVAKVYSKTRCLASREHGVISFGAAVPPTFDYLIIDGLNTENWANDVKVKPTDVFEVTEINKGADRYPVVKPFDKSKWAGREEKPKKK